MFLERLFAPSGTLTPYKMFTSEHFIMMAICLLLITLALYLSRNMTDTKILKTVRICTITLWIFETIKIVFNLATGNAGNPNTYVPLYFCSIILYAGFPSGYAKGKLKRLGDVFIAVGGITGGLVYLLSPLTTAGSFPIIHYMTIQSFLHHSIMVYLGTLFIIKDYIILKKSDWKYYSLTVVIISVVAYIVNIFLDSNLMFVSKTYPGTIIDVAYKMNPTLFPFTMTFVQAIPPFAVIYAIAKICKRKKLNLEKDTQRT